MKAKTKRRKVWVTFDGEPARTAAAVAAAREMEAATFEPLVRERDALRAQVEAARTYARQSLDYGEDCDATDLLAAMDGAKPK